MKLKSGRTIISICLFLCAIHLVPGKAYSASGPSLFIKEPVYDFGRKRRGSVVSHDFMIENRGGGDLFIRRIKTSCGCTVPRVKQITVPPGDTGRIPVDFDTKGREGRQVQYVTVFSNDPDKESTVFTIEGEAFSKIRLDPASVDFGDVEAGTIYSRTFRVTGEKGVPVRIDRVTSPLPFIVPRIKEAATGKDPVEIEVILRDDAPVGRIWGRVYVGVNGVPDPERDIRIFGRVRGEVEAEPPKLRLGIIGKRPKKRSLIIRRRRGPELVIQKVESQDGDVKAEVITLVKGKKYKIAVTPAASGESGMYLKDRLRIYTNSKSRPLIEIPVAGRFE